jgi:hypothetical protein
VCVLGGDDWHDVYVCVLGGDDLHDVYVCVLGVGRGESYVHK